MPRKSGTKPGPKSRTQAVFSKNVKQFLGDDSTAENSNAEERSFHSADSEGQTDYGLDFTHSISAKVRSSQRRDTSNLPRRSEPPVPSVSQRDETQDRGTNSRKGRKQRTPARTEVRFWRDVQKLQSRTDILIPRASFGRVVREILIQSSSSANRVTSVALSALQEAAEMYLTCLFQDAYACTLHRGRVTLDVKDIELTRFLRGRTDPGNR